MMRSRFSAAVLVFSLGFLAASALADSAPPAAATSWPEVDRALRSREYTQAVELIDKELGAAKGWAREALMFRRGLALLYGGKAAEAVAQFDKLLAEFPAGAWTQKARFRKADACVELKQFEAAEAIYAERVRELVGNDRKARIAQVYLDFAQDYFEPKDTLIKPDYTKARTFYDKALELEPGGTLRDDIMYRRALCNQKLEQWADAAGQYDYYLLVYDTGFRELRKMRQAGMPLPAPAEQPGRHVIQAQLGLGECRLAAKQYLDARRALQDLLTGLGKEAPKESGADVASAPRGRRETGEAAQSSPQADRTSDSRTSGEPSKRETWIKATYLLSKTYQMPEPPDGESLTLGVQILQQLLTSSPEAKEAIQAAHDIGTAYAHLGRHDEAIKAYRALIERAVIRPGNDETNKLAETLSQDALYNIGRLQFAQKKYTDAIGTWNQYIAKYPTGPNWSNAQRAIVDTEYQIGVDAVTEEKFDDARQAWGAFLQKYPLDARAPAIMYQLGSLSYQEQERREKALQDGAAAAETTPATTAGAPAPANEKVRESAAGGLAPATGMAVGPDWQAPIDLWRKLVNKFPNTVEAGCGQYMIGYVCEEKIKNLEAAIEEYTKVTWSDWANTARARLAELNTPALRVLTERTFRTDEPAKVQVDLRNIDKLTVKFYRVDMEAYYRKSHTIRGVEGLDLLLIDPDKTMEVPVAGYAKYKPVTQQLEVPFDGPGVWAVNVSTETAGEPVPGVKAPRIEATTLLIRSDIDVVIKTSRRQVLVFAENMRTQEPATNVRVLVSNGKKIVLEGKTDKDGVWHQQSDELKNLSGLSVFAALDGHIAGDALSMAGLGFSTGLQARGYLYTDRPTYQPGQAVNIRGILREIKDGQYALPTQPEDERLRWKLDVVDAKGRVLKTEALTFSPYGSFAAQFRVADDAPVGEYKLIARRLEGPTFSGAFSVQTYQLPKALVRFDFKDRVVMRGQPISGSIVVMYHYGEPVVGKTVEYAMQTPAGDFLRRSGVTDKDGKIAFEFDSTILPEEGVAAFAARQADLDIAAASDVYVAVRAFRTKIRTARPLYLSEEPVEATVETNDLLDKPIAQTLILTAFLRTQNKDQWAETKVDSVEVKTDAEKGVGRASLKLTKGGQYILRVEGKDKFDHVVSAEAAVQVSDDKDATRLRLFTERQNYKVGETIAIDLHSRIEKGQGEAVAKPPVPGPTTREAAPASAGAGSPPKGDRTSGSRTSDSFLALVTSVGDEVIKYRTVRINKGHNAIEMPVGNEHFPNFAVEVAVMAGNRFYSASRDFTVERQLTVKLTPDKTTYRPRDEMTVQVEVTDHQGKPAKAEIGLAMVDDALLSRYPDNTPNIVSFFQHGAYRTAEMRTQTSCTFTYAAQTRPMVTEVLAEARRMEDQAEKLAAAAERATKHYDSYGGGGGGGDSVLFFDTRDSGALAGAQPGSKADASLVPGVEWHKDMASGRSRFTYNLKNSDATEAARALNGYFANARREGGRLEGKPLSVNAAADSNALIIEGRPEDQEIIRELIARLDEAAPAAGEQRRIVRLNNMPSEKAKALIERLGEGESAEKDRQVLGDVKMGLAGAGKRPPKPPAPATAAPAAPQEVAGRRLYKARGGVPIAGGEELAFDSDGDGLPNLITGAPFTDSINDYDRDAGQVLTLGRIYVGQQLQEQVDDVNTKYAAGYGVFTTEMLGKKVAEIVQNAPPRTYYPELAYWNPRVETDASGKATVKIVLPDSSTKWKLVARGVTAETLAGGGDAVVVCKHDFVADVIMPPTLIEGDVVQPRAQVHCLTPYKGKIDVTLKASTREKAAKGGEQVSLEESDRAWELVRANNPHSTGQFVPDPPQVPAVSEEEKTKDKAPKAEIGTWARTIDVDGSGVFDVDFDPIVVPAGGSLLVEVTATTQADVPDAKRKLSDAVARAVPVRPWGLRMEAHAGGVAKDTDFIEIELPPPPAEAGEYHDRQLTVAVGPSMQHWLIEEALEAGPRWVFIEKRLDSWKVIPPRTNADTASSLLACLYASDYLRAQQGNVAQTATADARQLSERITGLVAQLLTAQNDDGGWPWCGKGESDPWVTAHIAWGLGKARGEGQPVADQAIEKLLAYLKKQFADAKTGQTELKAVTLHGISWLEEADFSHANRLYRNRQTLSTAALGHLAMTLVRLDRKSIAAEVLGTLNERMKEQRRGEKTWRYVPNTGNSCWMNSELEVTAMALLAQLSTDPKAGNVPQMVDYLVGSARADGWQPHKAKGTVLAALATYYARGQQQREDYKLAVSVNGKQIRDLTAEDGGSVRIDLADADLVPGKQRVDFKFSGRGEFAYAVTMSGFAGQFPKPEATQNNVVSAADRRVAPPLLEYKGRVVPVGFSVSEDVKEFFNEAQNVPVAGVVDVTVPLWRHEKSDNEAGDRDYIIVQETIPAGFRLLTETIRGAYLAYDYTDNVLTLYYGSRQHLANIQYQMVATTPGSYRLAPTVIRSLYRPDIMKVNKSDRLLTVLPRDVKSPDERRMTPDELYTLGRWHFDDADFAGAAGQLKGLLAGVWAVKEEPYRESLRMLLETALARNDADEIVNYFEILKEKYPDLVIPFEKIVHVADAYARTNQHERAYLVYRATADASFVRDANVGGVLQGEGRFLESIDFLRSLWRDYPDTPQVESVYYAISQTLYAQADKADAISPRRGAAGGDKARVTKVMVIAETIRLLESFLALYPESPAADEASYSLVNAFLELDDFKTVLARTDEMIKLFPESKWLDRFRYVQALAYFNLGDFAKALGLAQQVSESTYRDEQGVVRPSPNKWLALYIMGQIYHAQQQTAKAIEFYKKVKSQFSDAQEAVEYFEHKFVELPEVKVFYPDKSGFREASEWAEHLRDGGSGLPGSAGVSPAQPEKGAKGKQPAPPAKGAAVTPGGTAVKPAPQLYTKPFVDISYRNIKSVVVQVYRVDLMKLALVEKNLTQIAAVNLAGIKPIIEKTVQLGEGQDYVDKSVRLELDVTQPAGAPNNPQSPTPNPQSPIRRRLPGDLPGRRPVLQRAGPGHADRPGGAGGYTVATDPGERGQRDRPRRREERPRQGDRHGDAAVRLRRDRPPRHVQCRYRAGIPHGDCPRCDRPFCVLPQPRHDAGDGRVEAGREAGDGRASWRREEDRVQAQPQGRGQGGVS